MIAVACTGFASAATAELIEVKLTKGEAFEKRLAVAPGKFAEVCSALQRGQAVSWQFRADAATDFNVHYHIDQRVEYPEQRKNIKEASGRLIIDVNRDYCWMWTNRSTAPVVVDMTLQGTGR